MIIRLGKKSFFGAIPIFVKINKSIFLHFNMLWVAYANGRSIFGYLDQIPLKPVDKQTHFSSQHVFILSRFALHC